jgi:hypothetical protein
MASSMLARVIRVRNAAAPSERMTVGRIMCLGVPQPTIGTRWRFTAKTKIAKIAMTKFGTDVPIVARNRLP